MRQGLAFLFFLFCHLAVQAQDRLYAGGSREPRLVKITHIAETDLYFRLPGDTANLEYVMALRRVDSVIFANGEVQRNLHPLMAAPGSNNAIGQIIKVDAPGLLTGQARVQLEYPTSHKVSWQVTLAYSGLLVPSRYFGFEGGIQKRYFTKLTPFAGPDGLYWGPYARYQYISHFSGDAFNPGALNYRLYGNYASAGLHAGRQVINDNLFVFNIWVGLGLLQPFNLGTRNVQFDPSGQDLGQPVAYLTFLGMPAVNQLRYAELQFGVSLGLARLNSKK